MIPFPLFQQVINIISGRYLWLPIKIYDFIGKINPVIPEISIVIAYDTTNYMVPFKFFRILNILMYKN